jgi:hypothetical protein
MAPGLAILSQSWCYRVYGLAVLSNWPWHLDRPSLVVAQRRGFYRKQKGFKLLINKEVNKEVIGRPFLPILNRIAQLRAALRGLLLPT